MNSLTLQQFLILLTFSQVFSDIPALGKSKNAIEEGNIFKCKCNTNEALNNNGECVPAPNLVQVWDYIKQIDLTLDISSFSSVNIKPIECQPGFTKLNLNRTFFVIYTNGHLDNLILVDESPTHNYCIEHVLTENGVDIFAEVCEQNPTIPVCCPVGSITNGEGECELNSDVPFTPPLIGEFAWTGYNLIEHNITCEEREILHKDTVTQPHYFGASLVSYPLGTKLQWHPIDNLPQYYSSNKYCLTISKQNEQWHYLAHFCTPDKKLEHMETCSGRVCVRKCCPHNYIYDETFASCVQHFDHQIKYSFIDTKGETVPEPQNLTIKLGLPLCHKVQSLFYMTNNTELIKLFENGSLSTKRHGTYSSLEYCVDGYSLNIQEENSTILNAAFICHKSLEDLCSYRWIVGTAMLFISCIFYVLTIVVYAAIEELRSKMVGKCLISQVSSLLVSYLTLIFLINNNNYSTVTCIVPGTIEHVAILASFFWLNVMCFDMWSNIRSISIANQTRKPNSKKFLYYCLYAWGLPLLVAGARLVIDNLPASINENWIIRSHFGETHCFFSGIYYPIPKWVYLYGIIFILLVINLFFFIHVAVVIVRTKREAERFLKGPESGQTGKNLNAKKERAFLYLKLFLVMGITWILEIITWVAIEENDCSFWGLDIINMFQGVFIFIIFVCKKSTLVKVKERFRFRGSPRVDEYRLTEIDKSREEVNNVVA